MLHSVEFLTLIVHPGCLRMLSLGGSEHPWDHSPHHVPLPPAFRGAWTLREAATIPCLCLYGSVRGIPETSLRGFPSSSRAVPQLCLVVPQSKH